MTDSDGEETNVVEEKPRKRRFLGLLVTSVLMLGIGVAGSLLGPRITSGVSRLRTPPANAQHENDADDMPANPMALQSLVVDVRGRSGEAHHMKVGLTAEMRKGLTKEDFERLQPRGREVAISFLRGKSFEELTDPAKFEGITKELGERVSAAMGKKYTNRIVVTDYVVQ